MPTKGRPQVVIRWDRIEMQAIESVIERRNQNTTNPPLTFAEFVRVAVREKVQKMERSRGRQHGLPSPLLPTEDYVEIAEEVELS